MPDAGDLLDLENNFSEVAVALFGAGTVEGTLQQLVELAERTVDGCDAAGVLVVDDEDAATAASSSQLVVALDRIEIDAGEGPCLDAARRGATFYAEDLIDDPRWPVFGPAAVAAGV